MTGTRAAAREPMLVALTRATHPLPCLAVTIFVTAMVVAAGVDRRAALVAAAVLCGQLSVGWSNDAIDAPLDTAARRADKPIATGAVSRRLVACCAGAALVADVPLSLAVGLRPGLIHLAAVLAAWSYNLGLKRTAVSPLPYAVAFGLVPVFAAATRAGSPGPRTALVVAGVMCGIAAHFANTIGDSAEDALTGVRGLPQRIGPAASTGVAGGFVAGAAIAVLIAVGPKPLAVVAAAVDVAIAVAVPRLLRGTDTRRRAFRVVIAAVAVLVIAFVFAGGSDVS
ncbi:MAG TPA: UbiA family prenyltransferase [Mycobacteriales bacterium]|nr:UbiA family prenyltransferase [Mycobacteriales bacterium]